MPHGGRTLEELIAAGVTDAAVLQHAIFGLGGPEGGGEPEEGGFDLDAFLEDRRREEEGRAESISEAGTRTTRGETVRDVSVTSTAEFDELIKQVSRVYIDVPTPEKFLDDFSNAFSGFAQSAVASGMSSGDLNTMLDPRTGFIQSMLNEWMGNLAQRAARGEDLFEIVGLEGEPELVGTRPGAVTTTEIERMTREQAEEVLRERGEQVTSESVQRIIDSDVQRQQTELTTQTDETVTTTTDETRTETGERRFEEAEEIFRRPELNYVYRFSPGDFLTERFGELDEAAIGRLTTEIRASAPRQRPGGGSPAISARRA